MEAISLNDVLKFVQGGGNVALLFCVFVIWRAGEKLAGVGRDLIERLARIEEKLDR